jgi:uncharacterized protein
VRFSRVALAAPALLVAAAGLLCGADEPAALRARVEDRAGVLDAADRTALEVELADLERTDSTQIAVLIVKTTGGRPIEDYALEVARKTGLGRKGTNNGALILVAVEDRQVRIEVGEGLEGRVPDTVAKLIARREMVPRFQKGDLRGGVRAGADALVRAVRGEYKAPPAPGDEASGATLAFIAAVFALSLAARAASRPYVAVGIAPLATLFGWQVLSMALAEAFWISFGATAIAFAIGGRASRGGRYGPAGGGWVAYGGGGSWGGGGGGVVSGGGGSCSGGGASDSW